MSLRWQIYTDGACSGNPGPAGVAFVARQGDKVVREFSQSLGNATNNIAEYTAVIYALQEALIARVDKVEVFTDSELMYHQLKGNYKVKNENIRPLFDQLQHLIRGFKEFSIQYVPREKNKEADRLAKKAISQEQTPTVASSAETEGEESPSSKG